MLHSNTCPVYSVDASTLIVLNRYYPADVFPGMWDILGGLCVDSRLLVCEEAADECKDDRSRDFIKQHGNIVVPFGEYQNHLQQVQIDAHEENLHLVDPDDPNNPADPFVVALGLRLDDRHPQDLRSPIHDDTRGAVVTEERLKGIGCKRPNIPNVCEFYGLECIKWLELLRREGYTG